MQQHHLCLVVAGLVCGLGGRAEAEAGERRTVLITGGAGFIGHHVIEVSHGPSVETVQDWFKNLVKCNATRSIYTFWEIHSNIYVLEKPLKSNV